MSVPLVTHVTNNEPSPACENQGSKKLLHVALPRAIHLEIASFLFDPNTWLHGGRALCQTNRQFRQLEPDFIDRRPKTQKHELMNHILRMKHVREISIKFLSPFLPNSIFEAGISNFKA